ncbi:MAG: LysM peptidoglycan-binding domain-containing protein [Planctomycetia bacterium]|nr:LysM peptidoglycan-binding domain-containing protein [Planctomycetia bacterium]
MRMLKLLALMAAVGLFIGGCQANAKDETVPRVDLKGVSAEPTVLTAPGDAAPADKTEEPPVVQDVVAKPAPRTHTMKAGETLYSLAKQYYGDGKKWTIIHRSNKDKITDVADISIGTVLVIPRLDK